jgi:hypothetical protein
MTVTLKSRPDLVDVRSLTDRWRIRRDTRGADRGLTPDNVPIVPGRRGHVSAHDLTTLGVYVSGRTLPALLRNLPPGWRRHQIGDREATLLVPVADLDRAAGVVRAYRRRKLSPAHREALLAGASRRQNAAGAAPEGPDSRVLAEAS